jgi:hypothetical protein
MKKNWEEGGPESEERKKKLSKWKCLKCQMDGGRAAESTWKMSPREASPWKDFRDSIISIMAMATFCGVLAGGKAQEREKNMLIQLNFF